MNKQHQMNSVIEVKQEPNSPGFDHCLGPQQQHDKRLEPEPLQAPKQNCDGSTKIHSTLVPSQTHTWQGSLRSSKECNIVRNDLGTQPQHGEGFEAQTWQTSRQKEISDTTKTETHSIVVLSQTHIHQVSVRSDDGEGGLRPQNFHKTRDKFRKRNNKEFDVSDGDLRPLKLCKTGEELGGEGNLHSNQTTQISTAETSPILAAQTSQIWGGTKQEVEMEREECQLQNLSLTSAKNRETYKKSFQPQNQCSSKVRDKDSVEAYKKLFHLHNLGLVRVRGTDCVGTSKNSPGRAKFGDNVEICDNSSPSKTLAQIPECSVRVSQEVSNDGIYFQQQNLCPARGKDENSVENDKNSSPGKSRTQEFAVRIKQEVVSEDEELEQQNCHKTRGIGVETSLSVSHKTSSLPTLNLSHRTSSFHPVKIKQEGDEEFDPQSFQKMRGNNFRMSSNSAIDRTQDQHAPNKASWINQPTSNSFRTSGPFVVNFGGSKFPDENNSMLCTDQPSTNSVRTNNPFVVTFGNIESEFMDGSCSMLSIPNQQNTRSMGTSSMEFGENGSDESDCDTLPVHFQEQDEQEESFEQEKFYTCGICDSAHQVPYDLSEHFSQHVRDDRCFRCGSCQKTFQHIAHLTQHVLGHTFTSGSEFQQNDPNSFACHMCSKTFRRLYELNRHQKIHLREKPFICDICSKAFSRTDELNRHKRVHIGYRPFQCDQCQKAFLTNHELTQHKKTHWEEKPFMCHLCPRAFSRQDKLFHHGKIHTGHRSYPCDICDKAFITQSQLNQHKKIHSGVKPFVCEICHKAYLKNNDLNRHMKMHTGQKPYACETCGKAFHRADVLTRHKRTHNKVKRGKRSL